MISRFYVSCWLLARNSGLFLLKLLAALALATTGLAQDLPKVEGMTECQMAAVVLIAKADPTHFRMAVAAFTKCSDGKFAEYHSREVLVELSKDQKKVEEGALLMRMQAIEVARQMQADGAQVTDQDIIDHAKLIDTDAQPSQPHPSPSPAGMLGV